MSELTPEARAIINAASVAEAPPTGSKQRIHAAILAGLAAGAAEGTAGAAGISASSAAGWGLGIKLLLPFVVVGMGAGGAYVGGVFEADDVGSRQSPVVSSQRSAVSRQPSAVSRQPPAVAEPAVSPLPDPPSEGEGDLEPEPAPEPEPASAKKISRAKRPTQPESHAAPATAASIEEEMGVIGRANKALRAGDNAAAIGIAAEHAERFPKGQLVQEREAVRVRASCNRGDATARNDAETFLTRWPKSPYAAKVRASCKLEE